MNLKLITNGFLLIAMFMASVFSHENLFAATDTLGKPVISQKDIGYNPKTDTVLNINSEDDRDFTNYSFNGNIFFRGEFKQNVDFTSATFENQVDFTRVRFDNIALLPELKIGRSARFQFYQASLPFLIDFYHNQEINHIVNFTNANFDTVSRYTESAAGWHYINLYDSDIGKVKIDYQHFRLCFFISAIPDVVLTTDFDIDTVKKRLTFKNNKKDTGYSFANTNAILKLSEIREYLEQVFPSASINDPIIKRFLLFCLGQKSFPKRLSDIEINSIYENVLRTFQANGQTESYQTLDIEYKYFRAEYWNIPYYWYRFGYHKELIFLWFPFLLLIFSIFTFSMYPYLNRPFENGIGDGVYYVKVIPDLDDELNSEFRFGRRILYSLWYTAIVFCILTLKIKNLNVSKWGAIYIVFVFIIGLLCVGYLANFVLQK